MSIYLPHFRNITIRSLKRFDGLYSDSALTLLLGTAATESDLGTFTRQRGGGPARGVFQMEPFTFNDLHDRFRVRYPEILEWVHEDQETNLHQAVIMARLKYRSIPYPLPEDGDLQAMAEYYKIWFNSPAGAGTIEGFKAKYIKYIEGG